MNTRQTRIKSPHLVLAAAQQWDGRIGIGTILRGRDGLSIRKLGFVSQETKLEAALYSALLDALDQAAQSRLRGLTVYVDDSQVVGELNRETEAPQELQPWFMQIRCRANAMWPVRFLPAPAALSVPARRLAQDALQYGQTLSYTHDTPLLPLTFSEDRVA